MNKALMNYVVSIGLMITFVLVFFTGVIKFPGLVGALGIERGSIPWRPISAVHDWSGLIMGLLVFVHLYLNRGFMAAMTKKYFGKK